MKTLPFVISKNAVSYWEEIWAYTAEKWSVEQADYYYQLIFDEINYICKKFNAGNSMEHVRKSGTGHRKSNLVLFFTASLMILLG